MSSAPPSDEPTRVLGDKPPEPTVPSEKPPEPTVPSEKPPEPTVPNEKPRAAVKPAAPASERPAKAEKSAKSASTAPPKARTPSNAPSQTRSAILPLGIATGVLAGALLWLGSGNDEPPPAEPERAAQAPVDTPGVPGIHAANEPSTVQPAAVDTAAAPSSAEPAAPSPAAITSEAATTAAPGSPSESPEGAAPLADASEPIPSDEGLLEGPVTQVFLAPDCAELYRKGKRIGRSGVRVRVPEGKRRVFEVVCPGHNTRKLTLDGSRSEISIGLRPVRR